jgi:hypothetical protein
MTKTIWKVNLQGSAIAEDGRTFLAPLTVDAEVIATQYQRGDLCVWAIVDPDAAKEDRKVYVIGTGHPIPEGVEYVGTVQGKSGLFVWHVFA